MRNSLSADGVGCMWIFMELVFQNFPWVDLMWKINFVERNRASILDQFQTNLV